MLLAVSLENARLRPGIGRQTADHCRPVVTMLNYPFGFGGWLTTASGEERHGSEAAAKRVAAAANRRAIPARSPWLPCGGAGAFRQAV